MRWADRSPARGAAILGETTWRVSAGPDLLERVVSGLAELRRLLERDAPDSEIHAWAVAESEWALEHEAALQHPTTRPYFWALVGLLHRMTVGSAPNRDLEALEDVRLDILAILHATTVPAEIASF